VLAKELGPHKIRVNSIVPGWMWGPGVEMYLEMLASGSGKTPKDHYDEIAAEIPLGEIPPDDDCANAAVFFASDLSSVITGQSLDVNGGEVFH
jgi:NAD(P)-dependent dehydrogenase (short-subunit alcohol dehydrogenase family)